MRRTCIILATIFLLLALVVGCGNSRSDPAVPNDGSVVRILYFYSEECTHCKEVEEDVLEPLQADYGDRIEILWIETSSSEHYELLIRTEEYFEVPPEERGSPTLVIDGQILIGEEIKEGLPCLVDSCFSAGGTTWPDIPGLEEVRDELAGEPGDATGDEEGDEDTAYLGPGINPGAEEDCDEDAGTCEEPSPVWGAYFYETGCQVCSRAVDDIEYIQSRYPQFVIDRFNVYDYQDAAWAQWLAERAGRDWESFETPAIFIGEDALIGGEEITPQNLEALVSEYAPTGAEKVWVGEPPTQGGLVRVFRSLGPVAVAVFGLLDGLNPCAFATIIFFVSYLSISGRQGKEILAVGGSFTLGVFLAYLAVGLGFYKVLELLGDFLTTLGRWVYGLTAVFCAGLAVFSFLDFLKARRGDIGDMSLNLPHALRMRINALIRRGRRARAYVVGTFFTGLVVSFLELACTGQVYLPTIIAVMSRPELRARAIFYLVIYNLLFVVPLVVVLMLAYYGTSSKQLVKFLERNASVVKLGMVVLFTSLAVWLGASLLV